MNPTTTCAAALFGALCLAAPAAAQAPSAQDWLDSCRHGELYRGDSRERVCEVRELTLPAGTRALSVDGQQNGGIRVQGWDRNDVVVLALVSAWAPAGAEAAAHARGIRVLADGAAVRAEGPAAGRDTGWSVGYRVYVPRQMDLELRAHNGGLRVEDVTGRIEMSTTNGGISLTGVAGDVRGRTSNGGLDIRLAGTSWQGAGLDVRTTNGGVTLRVPDGYSATLETGTVNGRINTELPLTVQGDLRREISAQLGRGGAPIRARTTNGAVRIQRS
jgi:hypothetical protein